MVFISRNMLATKTNTSEKICLLEYSKILSPTCCRSINKHSRGPNIVFYWQNRQNIFKTTTFLKMNVLAYLLFFIIFANNIRFLDDSVCDSVDFILFFFFYTFSSHFHTSYI